MVEISQESGNTFLSKLRSSFGETSNTLMLLYSNLRGPATHTLQLCLLTWNRNRALWWDWRFIDGGCQVIIWNFSGGKKPFLLPCHSLVVYLQMLLESSRGSPRSRAGKQESSCPLVSARCPNIWHFGGEPMQSDGESGQRWWEPSLTGSRRRPVSHTQRCVETEANTCSLSSTNQLVPPKPQNRGGEHKGSYCGLMSLLEPSWQAQTDKSI